jgi:hypothetical protein
MSFMLVQRSFAPNPRFAIEMDRFSAMRIELIISGIMIGTYA